MTVYSFARSVMISASLLLGAACGLPPSDTAYQTRGTPESLLDISSEVVTLNTASAADVADLSTWIGRDQPTRAELNCDANDKYCRDAEKMLRKKGVPIARGTYGAQAVTLVYERIIARDCDQRYVDNPHNFYNTNHPAFGCSVAANMVQHVTDKREFVNPNTLDSASAARGVATIQRANAPRPVVQPYKIDDSIIGKSKSQ
jgi:hypothetical protein